MGAWGDIPLTPPPPAFQWQAGGWARLCLCGFVCLVGLVCLSGVGVWRVLVLLGMIRG